MYEAARALSIFKHRSTDDASSLAVEISVDAKPSAIFHPLARASRSFLVEYRRAEREHPGAVTGHVLINPQRPVVINEINGREPCRFWNSTLYHRSIIQEPRSGRFAPIRLQFVLLLFFCFFRWIYSFLLSSLLLSLIILPWIFPYLCNVLTVSVERISWKGFSFLTIRYYGLWYISIWKHIQGGW